MQKKCNAQIKKLIITGALQEGQSLPSMRQLAKDLEISVITTKRAYEELHAEPVDRAINGANFFTKISLFIPIN